VNTRMQAMTFFAAGKQPVSGLLRSDGVLASNQRLLNAVTGEVKYQLGRCPVIPLLRNLFDKFSGIKRVLHKFLAGARRVEDAVGANHLVDGLANSCHSLGASINGETSL
jgi:hypothetical protein